MSDGMVGELAVAMITCRKYDGNKHDNALWEAQRIVSELAVILEELDAIA